MKPLAITMGEPAGIGGELLIKAWQGREQYNLPPFFVIDNIKRLQALAPDTPFQSIDHPVAAIECFNNALPIINIDLPENPVLGVINPANEPAVLKSIQMAVEFCLRGDAGGIVTNPIHKAAVYAAGFTHPGHTEYIAELCGFDETPVMMLAAKDLRVVPLTVHIPLKDVPAQITQELLIEKARIIHRALIYDFGIDNPRIAVAGLNPHAGEDGKIGTEEQTILIPAIKKLMAEGLHVTGPYSADTMFYEDFRQNYDAAIGMYHDQALIPLKTIDFHGGVNVTLGLSVVRTSPDHGTGLRIAGQGVARAESLINAIIMAVQIAKSRNNIK